MRTLVWIFAFSAGLGIGAICQKYEDERDFILKAEHIRLETIKAGAKCDDMAITLAKSVLEYRGIHDDSQ